MLTRFRTLSLRRQWAISLGIVGLVPCLVELTVGLPMTRSALEKQVEDEIGRSVGAWGRTVGLRLEGARRELSLGLGDGRSESSERLLSQGFRAVAGFDSEGRVVWSLGAEVLQAPPVNAVGNVRPSSLGWGIELSVPAPPDSGVDHIVGLWDLSPLFDEARRGENGATRLGLVFGDGHLSFDRGRRTSTARSLRAHGSSEQVRANADQLLGYSGPLADVDTEQFHVEIAAPVFESELGPPLLVVAAAPRDRILAASEATERGLLLTILLTLVTVVVASPLLARLISKPLDDLTQHVRTFAWAGDRPPASGKEHNEIAQLEHAFFDMSDRVEEHQETLHRRNLEQSELLGKLRQADRLKDEFLSFLSHEIRTPLTAISSFAELLRTTPDISAEDEDEFLGIISAECARLTTLSNDLLDLARIDLGEMPWRNAWTDPSELLGSTVKMLMALAARSETQLLLQCQPGLPELYVDRDRIVQLVTNLVSNALKFTPRGGQVTVRAERSTWAGEPCLQLSVIDNGPGIPKECLSTIFDRFVQAPQERSGLGAGLGLAICKRIVNQYHGHISAENGPSCGATFRVWLPARPAAVEAMDAEPVLS